MLIAPLLVTLALKVRSLVGVDRAPTDLALVTAVGGLLALVGNPLFGRLSDRTTSRLGMRRPWMLGGLAGGCLGILVVATAPGIPVVLAGWCVAQLFFSALLVRARRRPARPGPRPAARHGLGCARGQRARRLGGRHVPRPALPRQPAGHVPGTVRDRRVLRAAVRGHPRRPATAARCDGRPCRCGSSPGTFYFHPRRNPDFAWAFASRFLFVSAFAFLTTYQAYYLIARIGSSRGRRSRTRSSSPPWSSRSSSSPPRSPVDGSRTGPAGARSSSPRPRRSTRVALVGDRAGRQLRRLPRRAWR